MSGHSCLQQESYHIDLIRLSLMFLFVYKFPPLPVVPGIEHNSRKSIFPYSIGSCIKICSCPIIFKLWFSLTCIITRQVCSLFAHFLKILIYVGSMNKNSMSVVCFWKFNVGGTKTYVHYSLLSFSFREHITFWKYT